MIDALHGAMATARQMPSVLSSRVLLHALALAVESGCTTERPNVSPSTPCRPLHHEGWEYYHRSSKARAKVLQNLLVLDACGSIN